MPAAAQRVTTTSAPTVTRSNRSAMSSLSMRMQPYEANVPIESGRFVCWSASMEIRRRTYVVRIFPNSASCCPLVRALAVDTDENGLDVHAPSTWTT